MNVLRIPTTQANEPTDQESRDLTALELRRIADRIKSAGWLNTAREDAATTLLEIAQAVEWGL